MPIKTTSKAAYLATNFTPCRREVMEVMMDSQEPMTRLEILYQLRDRNERPWEYSTVSARVNELIACDALVDTGECKKNPTTGTSANLVGLSAKFKRAATRFQKAA